jgi:hypothetical protein
MNDDDYSQFFHGYRVPMPDYIPPSVAEEEKPKNYDKEIEQLKEDIAVLRQTIKNIIDLIDRHVPNSHPLYKDFK